MTLAGQAAGWATATATDGKGSSKIGQRRGQFSEAILGWPTPAANDSKSNGSTHPATETHHQGTTLTDAAVRGPVPGLPDPATTTDGGLSCAIVLSSLPGCRLSARFDEWLMGLPEGWTLPWGEG